MAFVDAKIFHQKHLNNIEYFVAHTTVRSRFTTVTDVYIIVGVIHVKFS